MNFFIKNLRAPKVSVVRSLPVALLLVGLLFGSSIHHVSAANNYIELQGGCLADSEMDRLYYRRTSCGLDTNIELISSKPFVADENGFQFMYFGSSTLPSVRLVSPNGEQYSFPMRVVGRKKSHQNIQIPDSMMHQAIQLVVSKPLEGQRLLIGELSNKSFALTTISNFFNLFNTVLLVHLLLVLLFSFVRRLQGHERSLLLMPIALGLLGYLAFYAYYYDRYAGYTVNLIVLAMLIHGTYSLVRERDYRGFISINLIFIPISMYIVLLLTIAYFPYQTGVANDWAQAAMRWRDLPVDSWLPKVFADKIWAGINPSPLIPTWLSSDRPPLQAGISLLYYPISNSGMSYQVLSSYLQAMVFLPLLLLIRNLKLEKGVFWLLLGLMLSGFMASNTVFVWPKLISAMYLLIVYIALLTEQVPFQKPSHRIIVAGTAGALSMLCHGGAIFGLLPIFAVLTFQGLRKTVYLGIPSGLVMGFTYLPWILYQRLLDPPGDRLLKWHLAGHPAITDKSFIDVLRSAYTNLSWDMWLANKYANIEIIFERAWKIERWLPEIFRYPINLQHIGFLQDITFANFLFSFWFFSPMYALAAYFVVTLIRRRYHPEIHLLLTVSLIGLGFWILMMFFPRSTSIHQGTFFLWIMVYMLSSVLLFRTHRILLAIAAILNSLLFLQYYVLDYVYLNNNGHGVYFWLISLLLLIFVCTLRFTIKHLFKDQQILVLQDRR